MFKDWWMEYRNSLKIVGQSILFIGGLVLVLFLLATIAYSLPWWATAILFIVTALGGLAVVDYSTVKARLNK